MRTSYTRTLCTAVCLALCSTGALAAEYGIGVSAKSDDGLIYLPIDFNKTWRIEPSVRYATTEVSQITRSEDDSYELDTDTLEVGIGAFRLVKIAESAQIYFGLRAAYVDLQSTTVDTISFFPGFTTTIRNETSQDGYRIGPAIGFEYLFGEHFSIGGEASYTFLDIEGAATTTRSDSTTALPRVDIEQQSSGTSTRLIIRYRF